MFNKLLAALFAFLIASAAPALAADVTIKPNLHCKKNLTVDGSLTVPHINVPQIFHVQLSPNTGAAADSTVYKAMIFPGHAGVVTKVTFGCQTAPTVGIDTIKVLEATSSGNTMLSAASFNANTLVANTPSTATLTSTLADRTITASQGIYAEYSAGAQTVDAVDVEATIEFTPTDY